MTSGNEARKLVWEKEIVYVHKPKHHKPSVVVGNGPVLNAEAQAARDNFLSLTNGTNYGAYCDSSAHDEWN